MQIVESPNRWSCLPCAFATAIGVELPTLLEKVGHDGSEVIWPDLPEPECRRSFVGAELVRALYWLNYSVIRLDARFDIIQDASHIKEIDDLTFVACAMSQSKGVITGVVRSTGKWHAVAWDGRMCYDPNGFIYPLSRFEVHTYYLVGKVSLQEKSLEQSLTSLKATY